MKIKKIKFKQGENGANPSTITATLSVEEAILLAHLLGGQADSELDEMYYTLIGDVFNRYWDGGVDEAKKELIDSYQH